jgi:hypothetical protein
MRSNTEEFIKKAINKHGNKYNYSKVEYIKSNQKVFIICNNCKLEFLQKPSAHINGNGCSDCAHKEVAKHNTKSFDNFLELAKNIHKDNETGLDKYERADILKSAGYDIVYIWEYDWLVQKKINKVG